MDAFSTENVPFADMMRSTSAMCYGATYHTERTSWRQQWSNGVRCVYVASVTSSRKRTGGGGGGRNHGRFENKPEYARFKILFEKYTIMGKGIYSGISTFEFFFEYILNSVKNFKFEVL